jgi:uncharacterized oligopeptide transporter (OPT) family protein
MLVDLWNSQTGSGLLLITLGVLFATALRVPLLGRILYQQAWPGNLQEQSKRRAVLLLWTYISATYLFLGIGFVINGTLVFGTWSRMAFWILCGGAALCVALALWMRVTANRR